MSSLVEVRTARKAPVVKLRSANDTTSESPSESDHDSILRDLHDKSQAALGRQQLRSWYQKLSDKHEIPRKIFHSMTGFFTIWLYVNGYNQRQLVVPLVVMAAVCFIQDTIRLRFPAVNDVLCRYYGFMMRDSEKTSYNGILFFLMGLIITSLLLPKDLCLMSNLLLSWGDTSASVVGRELGKYTLKLSHNKSLAGSTASFLTGWGCCYLVYAYLVPRYHHLVDSPGEIFWEPATSRLGLHAYALFCGLIASVSELYDLWGMDDNFTIPVLSGGFLHALVEWFRV